MNNNCILNAKAKYTPVLALYQLQLRLQFLRDSLTFLRKLLFRNAAKLEKLDKKALLTTMKPTMDDIEALGLKEGDTLEVDFSYYSKESLEECLNNGLGFLEKSYKDFLEKSNAIDNSDESDKAKIDSFENLEFEVDKANTDLMVLSDSICRAVGDDYDSLWRDWH